MAVGSILSSLKLLYLALAGTTTTVGNETVVVYSHASTNWGKWGNFIMCPEGLFAHGFSLNTEAEEYWDKGIDFDDTALNSIRFYCAAADYSNVTDMAENFEWETIQEDGMWGEWGDNFMCGYGPLNGFQMRVQSPLKGKQDNTATNNIRFYCYGEGDYDYVEGDGLNNGEWEDEIYRCPDGYAICGLKTQFDNTNATGIFQLLPEGDDDDTGLNNVAVVCCKL